MGKWVRRGFTALLILAVVAAGAYYWLFIDNRLPASGSYAIDMVAVRAAAASLPGEKAQEIRVETVADRDVPLIAFVAGTNWSPSKTPVSSYQVVFPDRTIIIDTALDAPISKALSIKFFDQAAYARVGAALDAAAAIVVTHEHVDHIGGLLTHPNVLTLLKKAAVTKEQFDDWERSKPAVWPAGSRESFQPLVYDRIHALVPGVVLIKAAGHTPGSQMIYVQRADGVEFLFMGDVASKIGNVDLVRERSRLVGDFMVKDDRDAVLLELVELHRLKGAEPKLHMVPGHDGEALTELKSEGLLIAGFK